MRCLVCLFAFHFCSGLLMGETKRQSYSLQVQAFAPNAGGQEAYALRMANDEREWSIFANRYLYAGSFPMVGALYSRRFPLCGQSCIWDFYAQAGLGVSSAGPLAEVLWGTNLFWILRLDFSTHLIMQKRLIVWGYPLWVGISIPTW